MHIYARVLTAVGLAAGAEDEALAGAAAGAVGHAAGLPLLGVDARQLRVAAGSLRRADHRHVAESRWTGLRYGGRRQQHHGHPQTQRHRRHRCASRRPYADGRAS